MKISGKLHFQFKMVPNIGDISIFMFGLSFLWATGSGLKKIIEIHQILVKISQDIYI